MRHTIPISNEWALLWIMFLHAFVPQLHHVFPVPLLARGFERISASARHRPLTLRRLLRFASFQWPSFGGLRLVAVERKWHPTRKNGQRTINPDTFRCRCGSISLTMEFNAHGGRAFLLLLLALATTTRHTLGLSFLVDIVTSIPPGPGTLAEDCCWH